MSLPPITYPAICFRLMRRPIHAAREYWYNGEVCYFLEERGLQRLPKHDLLPGRTKEMVLVDSAGRRWEVRSLEAVPYPPNRSLRQRLKDWRSTERDVRLDLVEAGVVDFDTVKEWVCTLIDEYPDDHRDDEAIAGEDGPPRDEQELLEEIKARVRRTRSIEELMMTDLYADHPAPEAD